MAMQQKFKLYIYNQFKRETGFEAYLEYIKGAASRLFLKFHLGTHRLFEELDRHVGTGGSQECLN